LKIEVKRKKAKCPKCGEFVKMTYNGNIDQYEFSCCEKTYTVYKKITKINKRTYKRKEK
jgi:ribosomal protein S27AE